MAIAFGTALGFANGNSTAPTLSSLQVTGDNRIIIVNVSAESTATVFTSVTYDDGAGGGPQSFTQLGTTRTNVGDGYGNLSCWYLLAPNTGSSRRILAAIDTSTPWAISAVSYTGVAQSLTFTAATSTTDANSPGTDTDTSDEDGSWHMGIAYSPGGSPLTLSSGGTARQNYPVGPTVTGMINDSNATVANTIANSLEYSWANFKGAWVSAMMRPAAAAPAAAVSSGGSLLALGVGN